MANPDNVTALLYRRRPDSGPLVKTKMPNPRVMAFDPLLVFTGILVAGAAISQLAFLVMMEF